MGWVEERVAALRLQTGGDVDYLADLLCQTVTVHRSPGRTGFCVHYDDGTCDVWLPASVWGQLHEWGHVVLHCGLADRLRQEGKAIWRRQQIVEEGEADRFAAEWLAGG